MKVETTHGKLAGRSILEMLWEELDSIMDRLMSDGEPDVNDFNDGVVYQDIRVGEYTDAVKAWGEERGQAQGVAYAIAVMTNPYSPNVPAIKEKAVQRWEERQQ